VLKGGELAALVNIASDQRPRKEKREKRSRGPGGKAFKIRPPVLQKKSHEAEKRGGLLKTLNVKNGEKISLRPTRTRGRVKRQSSPARVLIACASVTTEVA